MGLTELQRNASQIFLSVVVAAIVSYWVTIFHDAEISSAIDGGIAYRIFIASQNNAAFLAINLAFIGLVAIVIRNLLFVRKINSIQPELRQAAANIHHDVQPHTAKDSLARFEKYVSIQVRKQEDVISALIYKPKKVSTFILTAKDFTLTMNFNNNKYTSYSFEEGEANPDAE